MKVLWGEGWGAELPPIHQDGSGGAGTPPQSSTLFGRHYHLIGLIRDLVLERGFPPPRKSSRPSGWALSPSHPEGHLSNRGFKTHLIHTSNEFVCLLPCTSHMPTHHLSVVVAVAVFGLSLAAAWLPESVISALIAPVCRFVVLCWLWLSVLVASSISLRIIQISSFCGSRIRSAPLIQEVYRSLKRKPRGS